MEELLKSINVLHQKAQALDPDETLRNQYLYRVQEYVNQFLNTIHENKSYYVQQEKSVGLEITGNPSNLNKTLKTYTKEVVQKGINPASGGHIGYIPGGGIFTSALADYLAAITNEYAGMYFGSPGAVNIENEVLDWLKSIFGFPKNAVGNLASGGSIANLIALTSARDAHQIKGDKIVKSVIYLSKHVHHCIQKALKIIGLDDVIIRYVKLDDNFRIDSQYLDELISKDLSEGFNPFLVVASAGTTDTGAVDPLLDIANIAKAHNLWYHIDAAYGGFFILTENKKDLFKGIEEADSLVIDPHKGLFLPYGVGAVLVKDIKAVFYSHHYTANYMQDTFVEGLPVNPADVSPELTKHFRGLRVWLPLQIHGIDPFIACLDEKLLLTEYFRKKLRVLGFELGPEPDLSVSYFWYPHENSDEFNNQLMEAIHQDGSVFLSSSRIGGRYVIRMAVLAFRTDIQIIDRAVEMISRCLHALLKKNPVKST